jgi:hypothetical protein
MNTNTQRVDGRYIVLKRKFGRIVLSLYEFIERLVLYLLNLKVSFEFSKVHRFFFGDSEWTNDMLLFYIPVSMMAGLLPVLIFLNFLGI